MAYTKTVWVNGSTPALDADHLNNMENGIDAALRKDGGTMTGDLILSHDPEQTYEAATKNYVDCPIFIAGNFPVCNGTHNNKEVWFTNYQWDLIQKEFDTLNNNMNKRFLPQASGHLKAIIKADKMYGRFKRTNSGSVLDFNSTHDVKVDWYLKLWRDGYEDIVLDYEENIWIYGNSSTSGSICNNDKTIVCSNLPVLYNVPHLFKVELVIKDATNDIKNNDYHFDIFCSGITYSLSCGNNELVVHANYGGE